MCDVPCFAPLVRDNAHAAKLLNLVLEHRVYACDETFVLRNGTTPRGGSSV